MIKNYLLYLILILVLLFVFFGMNFVDCGNAPLFDCLSNVIRPPEKEPEAPAPVDPTAVTASGSITVKGYTVNTTLTFPLNGGAVSGSFSGACDGSITGTYAGGDGGAISGTGSGTCSPFFVPLPISGSFSGSVNQTSKTVPINVSGKAVGKEGSVQMTLVY